MIRYFFSPLWQSIKNLKRNFWMAFASITSMFITLTLLGVVSAVLLKRLGYSNQEIIKDYMETKDNLMGFLTSYVKLHPEVDINIIIPKEENIKKVLTALENPNRGIIWRKF